MTVNYDVVVVGGGPAGSSAAMHLAGLRLRVLLLEKASMPRDKFCGEFFSTEVSDLCRRLGILERVSEIGPRPIRRVVVSSGSRRSLETPLPGTAFGMSRRSFDHLLFEAAGERGVDARDGLAVQTIKGDLDNGFHVQTERGAFSCRVVLGAYGSHDRLDRTLGRSQVTRRPEYVAFRARYRGRIHEEAIELHAFPGGYCGLLCDENDDVNVCWISHRDALRRAGGSPQRMIRDVLTSNERLRDRLSGLQRIDEFQACTALSFRRKRLFASGVCMLGDAAGMIAPLCGDGMGMALASGEVVASAVDRFVRGSLRSSAFIRSVQDAWQRQFSLRMTIGRWLHAGFVRPAVVGSGILVCRHIPGVAAALVRATRG